MIGRLRIFFFLLLFGASLGLFGCNQQGAGSSQPQGTEVKVELVNAWGTPATATVVYQVGDGSWELATQKDYGVYSFVVPSGETRYGVAVNCLPSFGTFLGFGPRPLGTIGFASVYQLTTSDTTEIQTPCLNLSDQSLGNALVTPQKDSSDPGSYDNARVYSDLDWDDVTLGNTTDLMARAGAGRGLLAIAYDSTFYDPAQIARIVVLRNVNVGVDTPITVTFNNSDAPTWQSVSTFTTPSDATSSYFGIGFYSKEGALVPSPDLGMGNRSGGSYAVVPGTESGDLYYAVASTSKADYTLFQVKLFGPDAQDPAFELAQSWFDPSAQESIYPVFNGLNYASADLQGYAFNVVLGGFYETIYVSKDWLGSATSYTVPDLSGAPDFQGTRPLTGDTIEWNAAAVMANHSIGEMLQAHPLALFENAIPDIPGLEVSTASKSGSYTAP